MINVHLKCETYRWSSERWPRRRIPSAGGRWGCRQGSELPWRCYLFICKYFHEYFARIESVFLKITMRKNADCVVKGHGLDVERGEDGLLVGQRGIVVAGHLGWKDDAHVTQIDVDGPQVGSTQRRSLVENGKNMMTSFYKKSWSSLHWARRFWANFGASSTRAGYSRRSRLWRRVWARGSGNWRLGEAWPDCAGRSEANRDRQRGTPPRDRWGPS